MILGFILKELKKNQLGKQILILQIKELIIFLKF